MVFNSNLVEKFLMNKILQFMKRNYKILIIVLTVSIALYSFIPKTFSGDPGKDKLLLELLTFVIEKGHYNPAKIDDTFSKGVYKSYINALDPSKRFFLKSDIEEFAKYELEIDNQINNRTLGFFDLTYTRLKQRMEESKSYYKEALAKPFDYTVNETFNTDFEKAPYEETTENLKDKWRRQIKLSTLSSLTDRLKLQDDKAKGIVEDKSKDETDEDEPSDKLSIETKPKTTDKKIDEAPKSFEVLEKETRESSLKSMNEFFTLVADLDRDDWFAIYINCIAERFDPHTSYFAPDDKDRFDVSMSGKLEGIGARLQKKNDFTEITELISGGPAWRGKDLESGDIILKVAQGENEPVDVVGMRLDDVVKKIKGPKGTVVNLTVKKIDGTIKIISITRDIVELEETYAKSSLIVKNGLKYGVINLPKFYIDFEDPNGRDSGKDMAKEVENLKSAGAKGIIIDLRDNGGGSLKTAVDIAGLFIADGPVVQVRSAQRSPDVLSDKDKKVAWDGPLVIMTNSFSASASEILAAAIQDYRRGIIIGSKQTYGKGTVQNVIDLDQFMRDDKLGKMGALKTTIQKFYRINGGSTQLEGVASDVIMPDRYMYLKMGERDVDNAMPYDKIAPASYTFWDKQNDFDQAIASSKARMEKNNQFKLIQENAKWIDDRNKDNVYSLNINEFKIKQEKLDAEAKAFKPLKKYKNKLIFKSLDSESVLFIKDTILKEKRQRWHDSLSKDVYVEEAINVLDDLQPKIKVEVIKKPIAVKLKKGKLAKI
jgi:carboxyl-terminal processing protease